MSSVTNNQNIILQAKQNYEKTLKTKVPPILVSLPSKGLVYPNHHHYMPAPLKCDT